MHYTPHSDLAFLSIEHIMRDVNNGWIIRYIHANGASMFFIVTYVHLARGIYFQSYRKKMLWHLGVIIFILMMATAFLGYVLPWGQMSLWGATVITNLFSAIPIIGDNVTQWLWGGFSVDNPTLKRFFSLHYVLPFAITGLVLTHLSVLHISGSTNPLGICSKADRISFYPYFYLKDLCGLLVLILIFSFFVFFLPNYLNHSDNYIKADSLVTPAHIVPEWYFLPFYAILRSIPNKLDGVIAMFSSLLILFLLPYAKINLKYSSKYNIIFQFLFWLFIADVLLLMWLGAKPPEAPYVNMGQFLTCFYFFYFVIVLVGLTNIC